MIQTTTRNATIEDLVTLLRDQHARKLDIVASAGALRAVDGSIRVTGTDPVLTEDGVTSADGIYVPTAVADEGIAAKLNIPTGYLRRMREERPDLYDANVNGWLHGRRPLMKYPTRHEAETLGLPSGEQFEKRPGLPGDPRSFLLRCFRGDDQGEPGIARAFLSDRYGFMDHLDILMSVLSGLKEAGINADIKSADLTDRRMVVRVSAPEVAAMAPVLLDGYRSPFSGAYGADNPTVFAGFKITNSETGGGRFTIVPEITVQVCNNGMTISKDAMAKTHLGAQLDSGVIRWSADTEQKNLQVVQAQTRDAVTTFLSPEYLTRTVQALENRAAEPVTSHDAVRTLVKTLKYTDTQIDGILSMFTQGGQMSRAGVVNAITAFSQTVEDGDAAYELDDRATSLLLT